MSRVPGRDVHQLSLDSATAADVAVAVDLDPRSRVCSVPSCSSSDSSWRQSFAMPADDDVALVVEQVRERGQRHQVILLDLPVRVDDHRRLEAVHAAEALARLDVAAADDEEVELAVRVLRTSFRPGISSRHERQPGEAKTSTRGLATSSRERHELAGSPTRAA